MTEHTTIQITKAQAEQLQERKTHSDESYKSVIARLLNSDNSAIDTDEINATLEKVAQRVERMSYDVDKLAESDNQDVLNRLDDLESRIPKRTAEELR